MPKKQFFPSYSSPKGSRRACLCKDKNTYSENVVMALYGRKA